MKMLLFHCDRIEAIKSWDTRKWKKALFCLICPTTSDSAYTMTKAVNEITRTLEYLKEKKVVMLPFLHLDSKPVFLPEASRDIKKIGQALASKGFTVDGFEMGDVDRFLFELYGHRVAVGFREV